MNKVFTWLLTFAVVAAFTSQSLVDLADVLIVASVLYFSIKNNNFKSIIYGFKPAVLWPVWLIVVISGLLVNLGAFNLFAWVDVTEFKWIVSFLCLIYLGKNIELPLKLLRVVSVALLVLNFVSLVLYFYRHDVRAGGIFDAVMAFSHNIAPILCLYGIFVFVNWTLLNRNSKILYSVLFVTSAILTVVTYTRGVWIGFILAVGIALFAWNYRKAIFISLALAVICAAVVFSNESIKNRAFSKTGSELTSNNERLSLWKANWRIVQDYPILGVGFGQNRNHLKKYYEELRVSADMPISHAHNQYLQFWAGTGTLGLLCYLAFLFFIFKAVWLGYKNASGELSGFMLGLFSALLCFVIGALTEANFNISKNRFLFLLLAGIAIGFSEKIKAKNPGAAA